MPRHPVVPSHRVYAPDGATVTIERPLRVAVVGATRELGARWTADALIDDLRSLRPDVLLLTGDYVARSDVAEWNALHERWDRVAEGVVALPGEGERRGDRRLSGHSAAFAGQGVPELRGVPFWHFDIVTEGVCWRFVMLDSDARSLGATWRDQLFWLPKVVTGDSYDRLVVAINEPTNGLAGDVRADAAESVATLLRVIGDHADPARLSLVTSGGAASNNIALPQGPYGPAHLLAGNGSVEGVALRRRSLNSAGGRAVSIEAMFAASLDIEMEHWTGGVGPEGPLELEDTSWDPRVMSVAGWWGIEIAGYEVALTYRTRCRDGSHHDLYKLVFSRSRGWVPESISLGGPG
jgi:hypothetical protein